MACGNCNKRKDQIYIEELAQKVADGTGIEQQVFVETTWDGDIYDFEQLGLERDKVVKIVKLSQGKYFGMFER